MTRLALTALLLPCACGPAPLEPRDPTPGAFHFTVESFNVESHHFGDPATIEAVGAAGADVVCLQEVAREWAAVLEARYAADYPFRLYQSDYGTGGLAVLSRFPVEDGGIILSPGGWHPGWKVSLDTPGGPMDLLVVHLRAILSGRSSGAVAYLNVSGDHAAEMRVEAAHLDATTPALVLGDFNEEPGGSALDILESRGFQDVLPLFHPGQGTWRHASVGGQMDMALDHILFDDAFEPLNAWVVRRGNSDHIPVLAHLELRRATGAGTAFPGPLAPAAGD